MIGFDGVAASAGRPARWGELMLTFVSAQEASMEAFLSLSAASRYQGLSRGYADSLLRQGCTRPAWCVVGLEAGVPVARAALWSTPDRSIPTDVVLIEVNWGDRDLADGMALLNQLHERARALGADVLMHSVDAPPRAPQHQEDEEARIRFLKGSGYELLWAGLPWSFTASTARGPAEDPSLAFRSLAEVGEDAFVETMASTYEGTRDSWLILNVNERGGLEAARSDFRDYQEMHHQPDLVGPRPHDGRRTRRRDHGGEEPELGRHRLRRRGPRAAWPRPRCQAGAAGDPRAADGSRWARSTPWTRSAAAGR
jgi:hypothetical protein